MKTAQVKISREIVTDDDPDLSYLTQDYDDCPADEAAKYKEQDKARLDAYNRGDWHMVGVRAKAEIRIPYGEDWIVLLACSPGLWGVESDSDESYFAEIFEEEKHTLIGMLESLKTFEIVED